MPRRRLLAVAIAGALALPALAACRDLPSVAAYVGSAQLTNAQVEKIVQEFPEATRNRATGKIRDVVVSTFVMREVATRIAADRGIAVPAPDLAQYLDEATHFGVPPDGGYVRLRAEAGAALEAIAQLGGPQAPTDADKHEVYDAAVAAGEVPPGQYEQFKDRIDSPQLRAALGLRPLLRDGLHRYQVVVNPRYQPIGLSLGELTVPLESTAPPAVVDRS
jgi:hypothetical protein